MVVTPTTKRLTQTGHTGWKMAAVSAAPPDPWGNALKSPSPWEDHSASDTHQEQPFSPAFLPSSALEVAKFHHILLVS